MGSDSQALESDPRLVQLCLNCERYKCIGYCEEYEALRRDISPFSDKPKSNIVAKQYELDGRSQTLAQWADEYGILTKTLRRRIESGMPLEYALTHKICKSSRQVALHGVYKPLYVWCEEYDIKVSTVEKRIERGMPLEQALKAPVLRSGGK